MKKLFRDYKLEYKINGMPNGKPWNRGNRSTQSQRFRDKYAAKNRAYQALYAAIKSGKLKRPKRCSICHTHPRAKHGGIMGHHRDYNNRLDVLWVCWKCHEEIHAKSEREVNYIGRNRIN